MNTLYATSGTDDTENSLRASDITGGDTVQIRIIVSAIRLLLNPDFYSRNSEILCGQKLTARKDWSDVAQVDNLSIQNDPSREKATLIEAVFGEFQNGSSAVKMIKLRGISIFLGIPVFVLSRTWKFDLSATFQSLDIPHRNAATTTTPI